MMKKIPPGRQPTPGIPRRKTQEDEKKKNND
mgnify:CR=1 FL=1